MTSTSVMLVNGISILESSVTPLHSWCSSAEDNGLQKEEREDMTPLMLNMAKFSVGRGSRGQYLPMPQSSVHIDDIV